MHNVAVTECEQTLVLVDPISSGIELKHAAKRAGHKVTSIFSIDKELLSRATQTPVQTLVSGCDHVIDGVDVDSLVSQLHSLPWSVSGVIAASEPGVELADEIAQRLRLPGNRADLSASRRDKLLMRQAISHAGLACPAFMECRTHEDLASFVSGHEFPLVIKTPRGAATSYVYCCNNASEIEHAFNVILDKPDLFGSSTKFALVEEYMVGTEYAVNLFASGSEIVATDVWQYDKVTIGNHRLYRAAILCDSRDPTTRLLVEYAKGAAQAVGIERGSIHAEVMFDTEHGPRLVEIAGRLSGGGLPFLVRAYSDFDPFAATVEVFTKGTVPPISPRFHAHLAVALCPTVRAGIVKEIHGLDEIRNLRSYVSHALHVGPGTACPASTDLASIPLTVQLAHWSNLQLQSDLKAVHELFVVTYEDASTDEGNRLRVG